MAEPDVGWKVFADGDEADEIPLWKALAQFSSVDLDEGLKENAAFINQVKRPFVRYYNAAFLVSLGFGILSFIFLSALLLSMYTKASNSFYALSLVCLAAAAAPHVWRQIYQYGLKTPDEPLDLPHSPNQHFDQIMALLQKVDGPAAYYRPRFGKKPKPLNRRQFFGKMRYFLFSEHAGLRRIVLGYRAGFALPTDIFLHCDDVEKLIAINRPRRKPGPGRKVKYAYSEAVFDLGADPRLDSLNLNDEAMATRTIADWLMQWFESAANVSALIPDRDQVTPYAKKIYDHLKNAPSSKGR